MKVMKMIPFIEAGKPVIDTEYTDMGITLEDFCPQAQVGGELTCVPANQAKGFQLLHQLFQTSTRISRCTCFGIS
jgi:hypothetical protein